MALAEVFDPRVCELGEGPLWHPVREQLFWFDIPGKRLLTRKDGAASEWRFDECVSAAGWIDRDRLLIASETRLFQFDLVTGHQADLCDLEAALPATRSNDGRADPNGGFWIGTMGKNAERGLGAFYRWYRGALRKLVTGITISNAVCFSPDGRLAYFCDTTTRRIQKQVLDGEGWPVGDPETFTIVADEGAFPDGAVVDSEGCLWNAQWGVGRVQRYDAVGQEIARIDVPAVQTSCPAFGGPELTDLYITTAAIGRSEVAAGQTFVATGLPVAGQAEHRVML